MARGMTTYTRRWRVAVRKRAAARLAAERLEQRLALATLDLNFTVPVEVANKGVYAAVFGNPTTSNKTAFVATAGNAGSMTVENSALFTSGQGSGSFIGEVTITDLVKTTIYKYQTNASNKLGGLSYVSGDTAYTYAAGSVVSFAGPDINQAPFVYLGSSTAAVTSTARTTPSQTVSPVLAAVLPVTSTAGFAASGSLLVYPTGQKDTNSQTVTYTGISGNSFTGVVCSKGIGKGYVVEQSGSPSTNTTTAASIGISAPTTIPVPSTAGFPLFGSLVAFNGTSTVRMTYTGKSATSFTGVYFIDDVAVTTASTIVAENGLASPLAVGSKIMPGAYAER